MRNALNILKENRFILFAIGLGFCLLGPTLWSDGMFMDGLFYATVSRNLAEGNGTWLHMVYTDNIVNHFVGHPPLHMWMQRLFFSVFGDSLFTERIFCAVFYLGTLLVVARTWRLIVPERRVARSLGGLSMLFLAITPIFYWTFSNNILETSLVFFLMLSLYHFLKLKLHANGRFAHLMLSAFWLLCAVLIKGPVGLIPLIYPLLYFICLDRQWKKVGRPIGESLFMLTVVALPLYLAFQFNTQIREWMTLYYHRQLHESLLGDWVVNTRYYVLVKLGSELIPMAALALILFFLGKKKEAGVVEEKKWFTFFILLGFAASVPVMLSLKQRDFYVVQALPYFALGFAAFIGSRVIQLNKAFEEKVFLNRAGRIGPVLSLLVAVVLCIVFAGKPSRNAAMIHDVHRIAEVVGDGNTVSLADKLHLEWNLTSYLYRYHHINVLRVKDMRGYHIEPKGEQSVESDAHERIELGLKRFDLFAEKEK